MAVRKHFQIAPINHNLSAAADHGSPEVSPTMTTRGKGRPAGFRMDDSHRTKIANSQVLNRLIHHVEGKVEMSATQVTAGVALLKKVLPDLAAVDINAVVGGGLTITIGSKDSDL